EGDRDHVARTHRAARGVDALAVNAHVTCGGERRRLRARAHHSCVPEPLVDALAIQGRGRGLVAQVSRASARLLGVRLELLLQRRELGERRIRVGLAVAAVPAVAAPLDIFRAQRGIAIRPVAARASIGTFAPRRSLAAWRTIALFAAPVTRRTIRARPALRLVAAVGTSLTPA